MAISIDDIAMEFKVYNNAGNIIHNYKIVEFHDLMYVVQGHEIESCDDLDYFVYQLSETVLPCVVSPFQITWFFLDRDDPVDFDEIGIHALQENANLVLIERLNTEDNIYE